jgi:hypothetical protein
MAVSDTTISQKQVHQAIDRFEISTVTGSPEIFSHLRKPPEKSTAPDFTVGELYGCICHRSTRDLASIAGAGEFS